MATPSPRRRGPTQGPVIPPSESIDPAADEAVSAYPPSNHVLSLSKHAWSPRPAFRQAQGEVVVVSPLRRQHESVFSLGGITCRQSRNTWSLFFLVVQGNDCLLASLAQRRKTGHNLPGKVVTDRLVLMSQDVAKTPELLPGLARRQILCRFAEPFRSLADSSKATLDSIDHEVRSCKCLPVHPALRRQGRDPDRSPAGRATRGRALQSNPHACAESWKVDP